MMRLWLSSYQRSESAATSASLSVVVHVIIVAGWVAGTLPSPNVPTDSIANHVYFIPPPDRVPGQSGAREAVHYIDLLQDGLGSGDGPRTIGDARPVVATETVGRAAPDSVTSTAAPPIAGPPDSVFSVLDVDTAVVRSGNSALPAYPLKLLETHTMGYVNARYVVDTTGFADTSSFEVMKATHPEFIVSVRDALPYMRFSPAKIGSMKVRQLVEQQFSFKINDSLVAAPRKARP